MIRYINLLDPGLRPKRELLSAATLAATLGAIVIVLAAGHYFARSRADDTERQLGEVEAQLKVEQEKVLAAGRSVAAAQSDPKLAAELQSHRAALQARESAMVTLASGALGDTAGFSAQLKAFGRQSMEGLWLTGFSLSGGGNDILIQGRAMTAEQVPAYLRRLNGEPAFRGKSFAALSIEEGKADPPAGAAATRAAEPAPFLEFRLAPAAELAGPLAKGVGELMATVRGTGDGKR